MTTTEYRAAVKSARRIIAFVYVTDKRRGGIKLSKQEALNLVKGRPGNEEVTRAGWVDGEPTVLLVGFQNVGM